MHLAQLNVGRLRAPLEDPLIDDFRLNLQPINELAESVEGFVWRLQDDGGDATGIEVSADPLEIINMSVWTSVETLTEFTHRSAHRDFVTRRRDFFDAPGQPIYCLWWIEEGTTPTIEDALARLKHLREHGPTSTAFTFATRFEPDGTPRRRR